MSKSAPRRRATRFVLTLLILICGGSLALAGCAGSEKRSAAHTSPFVINWGTSLTNLDPAFVCAGDDNSFASNFYGRLVKLSQTTDATGTVVANPDPAKVRPDLATSWTVSPDGRTYTFHLLPGAKFANGDPLDAHAVAYSIQRNLTIGGCGALGLQIGLTDPPLIRKVTARNPTTVVLRLSQANPGILYALALSRGSIYDPKEVRAHGGDKPGVPNQWLSSHTASSSGPYVLQQYVPNNYAVLVRNPHYYGPPAKEATVQVNFIQSVPTLMLQAQRGEADVTLGLPAYAVRQLQGRSCCKVASASAAAPVTVSLDNHSGITTNRLLRTALTYAVPYDQILKSVAFGYGESYYGPLTPVVPGYRAALERPRTYDPAKARELVKKSGIAHPRIKLMINPTAPQVTTLATILQSAWRAVGIDVTLDSQAPAAFTTNYNGGKYQAALLFEGTTPIAAYEFRKKLTCGSTFNNQHICIPGTTPLLQKLSKNPDDRSTIDRLTKIWTYQSPTVVLYEAQFTAVLNKDVTGFDYAPSLRFSHWGR